MTTDKPIQPTGPNPDVTTSDPKSVHSAVEQYLKLTEVTAITPKPGKPGEAMKVADDRSGAQAVADGFTGSAASTGLSLFTAAGAKGHTDAELADRRAHNAGTEAGPNIPAGVFALGASLFNQLKDPVKLATDVAGGVKNAYHTVKDGSTNSKLELFGSGLFLAGTLAVSSAGNLAKLTTETRTLGMAGDALAGATESKAALSTFAEGNIAAREAAVAQVERRAVAAASESTLAVKPALIAETAAPASTALDLRAAHIPLPEPIAPPSTMATRLTGNLAPTPRLTTILKEETSVGTLPRQFRVDGLKTGEGALTGTHPPTRFAVGEPLSPPAIRTVTEPFAAEPVVAKPIKVHTGVTEPVRPLLEPVKPVIEPVRPITESVKPAGEPLRPITESVKPAGEPVRPITESIKPAAGHEPIKLPEVGHEPVKLPETGHEPIKLPVTAREPGAAISTPGKFELPAPAGDGVAVKPVRPTVAEPLAQPIEASGTAVQPGAAARTNLESPALSTTPAAIAEAPAAVAGRASINLEKLTTLTSEKGIVFSPEAKVGLQNLQSELNIVSKGSEGLTVEARTAISKNIAAIEDSLVANRADATITRQFSDLKASVNQLAPSELAPIAPVTEAPATIAVRAGENIQTFSSAVAEQKIVLSPEAGQSLRNIEARVQAVADGTAAPLSTQASAQLSQDLSVVERSLPGSGADSQVVRKFGDVKMAIGDLSTAVVEREQMGVLQSSMRTLESQGAELSTGVKKLAQQIETMPGLSAADQKLASQLTSNLDAIEQKVARGGLTETPVATSGQIQDLVRDLDRPEYSRIFANNPEAARTLQELKVSTAAVAETTSTVESAQIGIGGIKQAGVLQQNAEALSSLTRELAGALPAGEAAQPVAAALRSIEDDLATLKTGANPETVARNVQTSIQQIEAAGAGNIAGELRQGLGEFENTATAIDRSQRLETTINTLRTAGPALESDAARLSRQFADEAVTSPSTTAALPVNAQVSEQLQLISRQAGLLDGSEAGAAAARKIKDAFSKVETLTANSPLTAEQTISLREMQGTIAKIDQATVEATGLRTFEGNAARIAEQTGQIETITGNIAKTGELATPEAVSAQVEQKLADVNRAAQEVRAAKNVNDQVGAINRLGAAVDDPQLQAYLSRNPAGVNTLQDLRLAEADLRQSVAYRALERTKIVTEAEAGNTVNAARALEARIEGDAVLAKTPTVQTAVSEYRSAAESFVKSPDRNLAAAQLDQKLADLQSQLKAAASSSAVVDSPELVAVRRAQAALGQSVADENLISRSLIDRQLQSVETGFDRFGVAASTQTQRQIMRDLSAQIQNMRYLEPRVGAGAEQLSQAQLQLTRAENDLEVAAYRRNLVKLAAGGDQAATDKLFVSGLTSDGFKANTMAATSGPANRIAEDIARSHANLQGLAGSAGQAGYNIGALAGSDPLFANNARLLTANALRYTGFAMQGIGIGSLSTGIYGHVSNYLERQAASDAGRTASVAANLQSSGAVTGSAAQNNFAPAPAANSSDAPAIARQNAPADASANARPNAPSDASGNAAANSFVRSVDGRDATAGSAVVPAGSRVIGHSASEPNGFSPNGQTMARNAFSQDSQAIPRAIVPGIVGSGSDNLPPALPLSSASPVMSTDGTTQARQPLTQVGSTYIYRDDVDKDRKLYNLMAYGTIYALAKPGEVAPAASPTAPFNVAQTLHIGGGRGGANKGMEKPASAQFVIPSVSAMLGSPTSLGLTVAGKRDVLTSRLGGGIYAGASGNTTGAIDTASLRLANSDQDGEEGGAGAGAKNLKGVERTETGLDSNAAHAGAGTVQAHNGHNDDEDQGSADPDPTATPGTTNPVLGSGRRVPATGKSGQPQPPKQEEHDQPASLGTPPPRRATKDAISA